METIRTEVVIVGAGPTGLSLACQLVRYGIDFIVVEKNAGVTRFSKALGVQARTLEIYEQMGLARPAVEQGAVARKLRLLAGGRVRGEMSLADIGGDLSPYPYQLFLEQSKNEELFYNYLRAHRRDVRWNTELVSFSQDDDRVTARVQTADGRRLNINAKYLVGCDGAGSRVRQRLGLQFEGSTFERLFYVADARVEWALPHDAVQVCLARDVFTAFFPMQGAGRYRIVGTFPDGAHADGGEVVYEEIERQIKREARLALEISEVNWFSLYKVHSRRVNKFSAGRCFVAGDAAHVHSPAGAQGMNTGIQDAYNLAWKLAFVLRGYAAEKLLATYSEERLANARRLLETTDRIFELAAGSNPLLSLLRTTVFPVLAGYVVKLAAVRRRFFPLISQIGINYRGRTLSTDAPGGDFKIKAGDRMPYFLLGGASVYDRLRAPKFHLLTFADGACPGLPDAGRLADGYEHVMDYQHLPLHPRAAEVFGTQQPFAVLLRPDNHVACISPDVSARWLRVYLKRLGARPMLKAA